MVEQDMDLARRARAASAAQRSQRAIRWTGPKTLPGRIPGAEWEPHWIVGHGGQLEYTGFLGGVSVGRLWYEHTMRARRLVSGTIYLGVYRLGAAEWTCLWSDRDWEPQWEGQRVQG